MSRLRWLWSRVRRTLWLRVSLFALLGVLAALLASVAGRVLGDAAPFDIGADAIESLLTIVASSMLAVTTFSVGALTGAYGSATSNATPRATALLTQDRTVQNVLATFVGTFVFSIVSLVALTISFYGAAGRAVLFLVTLGVIFLIVLSLLRWISHLTRLGRVSDTVSRIEDAARAAMEARVALPWLGARPLVGPPQGVAVTATTVGYVSFIDMAALSALCDSTGAEIDLCVLPGSFAFHGTCLARLRGDSAGIEDEIRAAFAIAPNRTFDQDPRFGLVVLSEVAQRALSPAINDPGTAIDVIGRQARLLTRWASAWESAAPAAPLYPRLRAPSLDDHDLHEDAFNLIGRDGAAQVDIMIRLAKTLIALSGHGPAQSRAAAAAQLRVARDRAEAALTSVDDLRRFHAALDDKNNRD